MDAGFEEKVGTFSSCLVFVCDKNFCRVLYPKRPKPKLHAVFNICSRNLKREHLNGMEPMESRFFFLTMLDAD